MNGPWLKAVMINVGGLTMLLGLAGVAWTSAISCASAVEQKRTDWRDEVVLIERPREGGLPPEIGTGFFVSSEGHILTAAHLLLESNEGDDVVRRRPLNVRLFGSSLPRAARILELNRLTDFALLKMKADERTPFLTLGDSRTVESGELLTLVGHPLGRQEWTVSAGMVDSITSLEHIFLQATLVKGQSGGPAIDDDGNVVGMASYREEGAQQSYLVPINDALGILAGSILPSAGAFALPSVSGSGPGVPVLATPAGQNITAEEKEPNNFGSEANVAPLGATIRGTLSSENKDALDFLRFDNPDEEPGKVRAIVRFIEGSFAARLHASVYDTNEEELSGGAVDQKGAFSQELPPSQSYVVKLFPDESMYLGDPWHIVYEVVLRGV
jgi:S1-C subfamily serine protease